MVKRKKTKVENFFNFNRYRKRLGADKYVAETKTVNFDQLKTTIIPGERPEMFQSYMLKDLNEHMAHLKTAFHGQPELLYYHAKLIVLIRREADIATNFAAFEALWELESDFLLEHLNMRWLISACDTFIDHSKDMVLKSILLNVIMMINTIKLYETEYFLLGLENVSPTDYLPEQLDNTRHCFNLFDELPSFRVGVDDSLRNMRWRMEETSQKHPLAHQILINVFDRVNEKGSVYTRFKAMHTKPRSAWWSE